MKVILFALVVFAGVCAYLVFTDNVDVQVDAAITSKGKSNVNSGIDTAAEALKFKGDGDSKFSASSK